MTRMSLRSSGPQDSLVMRGLDPRIHLLARAMGCRVKPGNDESSQIKPPASLTRRMW
jgi:hypothetical protein